MVKRPGRGTAFKTFKLFKPFKTFGTIGTAIKTETLTACGVFLNRNASPKLTG